MLAWRLTIVVVVIFFCVAFVGYVHVAALMFTFLCTYVVDDGNADGHWTNNSVLIIPGRMHLYHLRTFVPW